MSISGQFSTSSTSGLPDGAETQPLCSTDGTDHGLPDVAEFTNYDHLLPEKPKSDDEDNSGEVPEPRGSRTPPNRASTPPGWYKVLSDPEMSDSGDPEEAGLNGSSLPSGREMSKSPEPSATALMKMPPVSPETARRRNEAMTAHALAQREKNKKQKLMKLKKKRKQKELRDRFAGSPLEGQPEGSENEGLSNLSKRRKLDRRNITAEPSDSTEPTSASLAGGKSASKDPYSSDDEEIMEIKRSIKEKKAPKEKKPKSQKAPKAKKAPSKHVHQQTGGFVNEAGQECFLKPKCIEVYTGPGATSSVLARGDGTLPSEMRAAVMSWYHFILYLQGEHVKSVRHEYVIPPADGVGTESDPDEEQKREKIVLEDGQEWEVEPAPPKQGVWYGFSAGTLTQLRNHGYDVSEVKVGKLERYKTLIKGVPITISSSGVSGTAAWKFFALSNQKAPLMLVLVYALSVCVSLFGQTPTDNKRFCISFLKVCTEKATSDLNQTLVHSIETVGKKPLSEMSYNQAASAVATFLCDNMDDYVESSKNGKQVAPSGLCTELPPLFLKVMQKLLSTNSKDQVTTICELHEASKRGNEKLQKAVEELKEQLKFLLEEVQKSNEKLSALAKKKSTTAKLLEAQRESLKALRQTTAGDDSDDSLELLEQVEKQIQTQLSKQQEAEDEQKKEHERLKNLADKTEQQIQTRQSARLKKRARVENEASSATA